MKIDSVLCRKFSFHITPVLEGVFSSSGITQLGVNCALTSSLDLGKKSLFISISMTFQGDTIPSIASDWAVIFSDLPEGSELKAMLAESPLNGALSRLFGSFTNNVNWVLMNTKLGPLPLHHGIFMKLLENSITAQPVAPPKIEQIKATPRKKK